MVQHVGKATQVSGLAASGVVPREEGASGGQGKVGRARLLAELLEKRQIVGGIIVADSVAAKALLVRVFKTVRRVSMPSALTLENIVVHSRLYVLEVQSIEAVLVDQIHANLRKGSPVGGRAEVR